MTRYYFHIADGDCRLQDRAGQVMPDIDAARAEAIRSARSIIAEQVRCGSLSLRGNIQIVEQEQIIHRT
jgi:hypothetical protein